MSRITHRALKGSTIPGNLLGSNYAAHRLTRRGGAKGSPLPSLAGNGYIAGVAPGVLTVNGAPASREIEVRDRSTRAIVFVGFCNPDGTYRVNGLNPARKYDVIARDWQGVYNDVIRSNITPAT